MIISRSVNLFSPKRDFKLKTCVSKNVLLIKKKMGDKFKLPVNRTCAMFACKLQETMALLEHATIYETILTLEFIPMINTHVH